MCQPVRPWRIGGMGGAAAPLLLIVAVVRAHGTAATPASAVRRRGRVTNALDLRESPGRSNGRDREPPRHMRGSSATHRVAGAEGGMRMRALNASFVRAPSQPLALLLLVILAGPAWGGGLASATRRGAVLDPGLVPGHGPYDAPIPGIFSAPRPDVPHGHRRDRGPRPHGGGHDGTPFVRTGLCRYPWLGGYIPPSPYDDCLYRTGPHAWQR